MCVTRKVACSLCGVFTWMQRLLQTVHALVEPTYKVWQNTHTLTHTHTHTHAYTHTNTPPLPGNPNPALFRDSFFLLTAIVPAERLF